MKNWPEDGKLEPKHAANYVLMTIYLLCLTDQITLPEVDVLRFVRSTLPRSKSANRKYSNMPDTTSEQKCKGLLHKLQCENINIQVRLAEWSKAPDLSSGSPTEIVGSNPTPDNNF